MTPADEAASTQARAQTPQLFKLSIDCVALRAHEVEALLRSQTSHEPLRLRRLSVDLLSDTRTSLTAYITCPLTGRAGLAAIVKSLPRHEGVLEVCWECLPRADEWLRSPI